MVLVFWFPDKIHQMVPPQEKLFSLFVVNALLIFKPAALLLRTRMTLLAFESLRHQMS